MLNQTSDLMASEERAPSNREALSKSHLQEILRHALEGFLFLDQALTIQPDCSASAGRYLGEKDPAGLSFIAVLENKVPEEVIEKSREFLTLMFDADLDEETLAEINPLSESELCYENNRGLWEETSYLNFNFERIFTGGKITGILVRLNEVSRERELLQRLNDTEQQVRQQMEWLVNILHVESSALREFLAGAERELHHIEQHLRQPGKPQEYHQLLENIYRSVYIIRGNAALMDLTFFAEYGHKFLNLIAEVREQKTLGAHDFIPVVVRVKELRSTLVEVRSIVQRVSRFHDRFRAKRSYESELLIHSIRLLVNSLGSELGKQVQLVYSDFDPMAIPFYHRQAVKEILYLLTRNALYYGIESPEERQEQEKPALATIEIASKVTEDVLDLRLRHDGRILKIERLIERMLDQYPRLNDERAGWNDADISRLIFTPGMVDEEERDLIGGYSLDIELLRKRVQSMGGRMKITFTSKSFCDVNITLPIRH